MRTKGLGGAITSYNRAYPEPYASDSGQERPILGILGKRDAIGQNRTDNDVEPCSRDALDPAAEQ